MSSKTFSSEKILSKALFKTDLKNHWVWMLVAAVILSLNVLVMPSSRTSYLTIYDFYDFISFFGFSHFFAAFFGFFIGTKLFFYLDKVNSVSCMHGLPFSRRKLYLSHLISGGTIILLPVLASLSIMMISGIGNTIITAPRVFAYFALYLIYGLIGFSISVFSMTICGNVVVSMLLSLAITVMPAALLSFVDSICSDMLYGYTSNGKVLSAIIDHLYIASYEMFPWKFALYLVYSVMFLTAGYFIYKIRPLENCEEVVAFRKLRGLFVYSIGIVCGMISYLFFFVALDANTLFAMLPLGIVGVLVSSMIAQKAINFKGSWKYLLIFTAAVSTLSLAFHFDIFGYENRVPKVSDVEYVTIGGIYDYDPYSGYSFRDAQSVYHTVDIAVDKTVEDPEDIEKIIALHKAYISDKNADMTDIKYHHDDSFVFRYKLKNGTTLTRSYYYLSDEKYEEFTIPVINIKEVKASKNPLADGIEKTLTSEVRVSTLDNAVQYFGPKTAEAKKLFEAVIADVNANPTEALDSNGSLRIRFDYLPDIVLKEIERYPKATYNSMAINVYINENYTETLKVLEELGIIKFEDVNLDHVNAVIINSELTSKNNYREQTYDSFSYITYPEKVSDIDMLFSVSVLDKEDIKNIYKYCSVSKASYMTAKDHENMVYLEMIFVDENASSLFKTSFTVKAEDVPEFIGKYLKN